MLNDGGWAAVEAIRPALTALRPVELRVVLDRRSIVDDPRFAQWTKDKHACFYAPFDWVNERADVVLIGITPGLRQATDALLALQDELKRGASVEAAAKAAKVKASFAGDMREIAARLMDHFGFHRLFGLRSSADLFGAACSRVHYTSVLRYPVLERKNAKAEWKNYGGDDQLLRRAEMACMVTEYLTPELQQFPNSWLVPFGPVPAFVLGQLAASGLIDERRVLPGLNHPSGTQWNRHNCQLNLVDHRMCAKNVGCSLIQDRSRYLHELIRDKIASTV